MKSKKEVKTIIDPVVKTIDTAQKTVEEVYKEADSIVEPVRKSVLHRFPTLFLLLVTFGVVTVGSGFEKLVSQYQYLNERPWLILLIGLGTLVLTGTLYKKLR